MEWKRYKLQAFDLEGAEETPLCILEAPSPGAAIELFLAVHGMLHYRLIRLGETDEEPNEDMTRSAILSWAGLIEEQAEMLDQCHRWKGWEDEG